MAVSLQGDLLVKGGEEPECPGQRSLPSPRKACFAEAALHIVMLEFLRAEGLRRDSLFPECGGDEKWAD